MPSTFPSVFADVPAPSTERMPGQASDSSSVNVNVSVATPHMSIDDATHEDAAPSRADLLQRAAELGPSRMTWENIVLQPTDPILADKMQPRVAERRARFRRVVKVALGACVALCVIGTAATAISAVRGGSSSSATASVGKAAPAAANTPIEKLEQPTLTKAARTVTASARPTPRFVAKRR